MSKLIMITGGARSGKSSFAESMLKKLGGTVLYVATSIPFDDEMKLRIKKHREQRPAHWETLEAYKGLDVRIPPLVKGKSAVLLDCITIMVTNIMMELNVDWSNLDDKVLNMLEETVRAEIRKLIATAETLEIPFVMVTNEVGMGIVPDNALARVFRDIAGRVNQMIAAASEEVYLCVSGIPVKIKPSGGMSI